MKITREDVVRVADLAHLELGEAEVDHFRNISIPFSRMSRSLTNSTRTASSQWPRWCRLAQRHMA